MIEAKRYPARRLDQDHRDPSRASWRHSQMGVICLIPSYVVGPEFSCSGCGANLAWRGVGYLFVSPAAPQPVLEVSRQVRAVQGARLVSGELRPQALAQFLHSGPVHLRVPVVFLMVA